MIFSNDQISSVHRIPGGLSFGKQIPPSPRSSIARIAYDLRTQTASDSNHYRELVDIVIFAGVREYPIRGISVAEGEWLLAELSEWLDVPISKSSKRS